MSDFETHPVGTAAHIAALTAQVAELEVKLGGALLGQWIDAGMPNDPAKAEAAALRAKLARIASAWPIVRDADCSGGTLASAMDEIEAAISDGAAEDEAAALRAKVARLEEKAVLWIEQGMVIVAPESVPQRRALESYRKQFAELVRAALTDGGKHE